MDKSPKASVAPITDIETHYVHGLPDRVGLFSVDLNAVKRVLRLLRSVWRRVRPLAVLGGLGSFGHGNIYPDRRYIPIFMEFSIIG